MKKSLCSSSRTKDGYRVKIKLKTPPLSFVTYTNGETYEEPSEVSKMDIFAKSAWRPHSFTLFANSSIPDVLLGL